MHPNLKALLELLLSKDIDFVLVGGFAAAVHGSTLVTQDIDICMAITPESVAKLRAALKDLHPWHRMNPTAKLSFQEHPAELKGTNNIYLKTDLGVLDVLSQVPPAGDFQAIRSRAVSISLYGRSCKVISIEDLIRVKESMDRSKDQQAVQELKIILGKVKS